MNAIRKAEQEGRLTFDRWGRMKYIPTKETQEKMARYKKPFDSEKANKLYDLKISNRKTWSEVDRRLEKIERYVDKGLIKIHNKEFILK